MTHGELGITLGLAHMYSLMFLEMTFIKLLCNEGILLWSLRPVRRVPNTMKLAYIYSNPWINKSGIYEEIHPDPLF